MALAAAPRDGTSTAAIRLLGRNRPLIKGGLGYVSPPWLSASCFPRVLARAACFGKVRPAERVDLLVVVSIGLLQMMLLDGHGPEV